MNVHQLKRRHWLGISLAVGLLVGTLHASLDQFAPTRNMTPAQFESALLSPALRPGDNFVRDITIFPAQNDSNLVRFEVLTPTGKPNQWEYVPRQIEAPIPYPPTSNVSFLGAKIAADYTVIGYLKQLEKKTPQISYTFAWWAFSGMSLAVWALGSLLVVGVIFPTLINLLVGAGFGPSAEPVYDLDRFSSKAEKHLDIPFPTDRDPSQITKVISNLEVGLRNRETTASLPIVQTVPKNDLPPPAPAKIDDAEQEPNDTSEKMEKHYEGKYYPTALSVHPPSVDSDSH